MLAVVESSGNEGRTSVWSSRHDSNTKGAIRRKRDEEGSIYPGPLRRPPGPRLVLAGPSAEDPAAGAVAAVPA